MSIVLVSFAIACIYEIVVVTQTRGFMNAMGFVVGLILAFGLMWAFPLRASEVRISIAPDVVAVRHVHRRFGERAISIPFETATTFSTRTTEDYGPGGSGANTGLVLRTTEGVQRLGITTWYGPSSDLKALSQHLNDVLTYMRDARNQSPYRGK